MLVATMPRAHVNDYLKGAFKIVVDAENDLIPRRYTLFPRRRRID